MKKHPDRKLTVRQAYEKYKAADEVSRSTTRKYNYDLRRWEKLSGNPIIGEITNATLAEFRAAAIAAGLSPSSINTTWRTLKAILRRIARQETGNPWGEGIIEHVPQMRLVREVLSLPRRVSLNDLAAFYVACRHAQYPRRGPHPSDWWRALLVTAYCTGLRRGDLIALEWSQIDLQAAEITFAASKTQKAAVLPLHPCAVAHLERIRTTGQCRVFRSMKTRDSISGSFYTRWRWIMERSAVAEPFTLHDVRRTIASEIDRARPGLGSVLLQHSPRSVTSRFYLNQLDELREALADLRLPPGWSGGAKVAGRKQEEVRQARVAMTHDDFTVPSGPDPRDWKFKPGAFWCRGKWFPTPSALRLAVLKALATSAEPVTVSELQNVIRATGAPSVQNEQDRVAVTISNIRARLRRMLGLAEDVDPLPCVQRCNGPSVGEAAWTIWLPVEMQRKGGAA